MLDIEPDQCREYEVNITQDFADNTWALQGSGHGLLHKICTGDATLDCKYKRIAGGHSVWAALPPFPALPAKDARPITLVTAAIDSTAFFHDLAKVPLCPNCCKINNHGSHNNCLLYSCAGFLNQLGPSEPKGLPSYHSYSIVLCRVQRRPCQGS